MWARAILMENCYSPRWQHLIWQRLKRKQTNRTIELKGKKTVAENRLQFTTGDNLHLTLTPSTCCDFTSRLTARLNRATAESHLNKAPSVAQRFSESYRPLEWFKRLLKSALRAAPMQLHLVGLKASNASSPLVSRAALFFSPHQSVIMTNNSINEVDLLSLVCLSPSTSIIRYRY